MAKYEIMLIADPKADVKSVEDLVNGVFKGAKFEKYDKTELAYEINKSKTAKYFLVNVEANGEDIKEFQRKANIDKAVWRYLTINLDKEVGMDKQAKKLPPRSDRPRRPMTRRDDYTKPAFVKKEDK